jgi:hypothetical protein
VGKIEVSHLVWCKKRNGISSIHVHSDNKERINKANMQIQFEGCCWFGASIFILCDKVLEIHFILTKEKKRTCAIALV